MPESKLQPLILQSERQRGGELHLQLRLSDGRTCWVILPAGELADELLAELDPHLVTRLTPARPLFG
jgi:6-phosphogluconate dehydrogenase (decarboxylating)